LLLYARIQQSIGMSGTSGGYCPICGKSYGPEAERCPIHGYLFQSRDALRPGIVIDGAYEILQRLGAGGMGETYLVRHAFLGENLVLKRIRPELAEDPLYQQSFLREAHSLAALRKLPAVVEIRNAWQTREGYLALLLEYVEGGNLLQWLDTARGGGPLEALEAVAIAADLARALAAAHAIGVLHRDVKPQNILMRQLESGGFQLKLCDFGLAVQRVEEMSRQGTTTTRLGTPGYAAPEQYTMSSREQDARVDVFGLGMTLYRLATGRLPWEASSASWPLVCKEQPRKSLKELRPALAREYWLESMLLRMTAVERNDRIATAAEALELMQEALSETRPAPPSMVRPAPRIPPVIVVAQVPPPPPPSPIVTQAERDVHSVPAARPAGTGGERRADSTAGTKMPAGVPAPADHKSASASILSPEPLAPPPAELQQSPVPPLPASKYAATEHEHPTEAVASTGITGEQPQVEPAANTETPAGPAVAVDYKNPSVPAPSPERHVPAPVEWQQPLPSPPWAPADPRTEREVPGAAAAVLREIDNRVHAEPDARAEVAASAAAPGDDTSASAPAPSPEPQVAPPAEWQQPSPPPLPATGTVLLPGGTLWLRKPASPPPQEDPREEAVEGSPIELPFLSSQLEPNSLWSRRAVLVTAGSAIVALLVILGGWLALHRPEDVPVNPPEPVTLGTPAPAPHSPAPATVQGAKSPAQPTGGPTDRELSTLRDSVVGAVRAKNWSKAGPLINGLLAKFPTDAEALEWRKLLSEGRKSDLFAKLNPQREDNGPDVARAEQLLQQGDYSGAITLFQRVLARDPGNARARKGLKQATDAKTTEDRIFGGGR
jgi:serine/threonine protein kinase